MFTESLSRLPETLLVCSKVFEPPLKSSDLRKELLNLQGRVYDLAVWNSCNFSIHLFEQGSGKEYEYR